MVHGRRVVVVVVVRHVVVVVLGVVYFVVAGKFHIFVLGFDEGVGFDGPFYLSCGFYVSVGEEKGGD